MTLGTRGGVGSSSQIEDCHIVHKFYFGRFPGSVVRVAVVFTELLLVSLRLVARLSQETETMAAEDTLLDTDEEEDSWGPSEIEDGLLLGSIADATNGSALVEHGVTVVVSVLDATQDHEQLVLPETIKHLRFKCADRSDANLLRHLGRAANAVAAGLQNGSKVLVHCMEGRSRSSTVVCAYLIKHRKMSLRDAFTLVKQRREHAEPNRGFWRQLVAFERGVHQSVSFTEEELPGCVMFEQDALDLMVAEHEASLAISPLKPPPQLEEGLPPQAPPTTPERTTLPRKRKVPDSLMSDRHVENPSCDREQPHSSVVEPDNTTKKATQ